MISVGDGIARVYGLENVMAGELVEFGPRRRLVSRSIWKKTRSARYCWATTADIQGRRPGQAHRPHHVDSGGRCMVGRVVNALGAADRRQRADRDHGVQSAGTSGAGRCGSATGEAAAADRY